MENNVNLNQLKGRYIPKPQNTRPVDINTSGTSTPSPSNIKPPSTSSNFHASQSLQTALMGGAENAAYIKEMMKFPKNFNALIYIIQRNLTNTQLQAQLHNNLLASRHLTQTQAQILAQLQGLNSAELMQNNALNQTLLSQLEASIKRLPISSSGLINIADLATLIKTNGKEALTQIIISMANSAKNGINDVSQMKEAAKLINASIAIASQKDNSQTLKILMLLYLPWLPLQQGVDFELDIQSKEENASDNSVLIIKIQTINYGEIVVMLVLESANAISINIQCAENFPQDELNLRLNNDKKTYSAQTSLSYTSKPSDKTKAERTQATINMSNTNEINPYLLLMSHLIIRHIVEIDRLCL